MTKYIYLKEYSLYKPTFSILNIINVDDDYIWLLCQYNKTTTAQVTHIVRVTHSEDNWTVYENADISYLASCVFDGNWIYYRDETNGYPCRIRKDGGKQEVLTNAYAIWNARFEVCGNRLWFMTMVNADGEYRDISSKAKSRDTPEWKTELRSVSCKGSPATKVAYDISGYMTFHDGWVYWIAGDCGHRDVKRTSLRTGQNAAADRCGLLHELSSRHVFRHKWNGHRREQRCTLVVGSGILVCPV